MDHHVFPSFHGCHAEDAMEVIGRHDLDGVDILFFIEELPEIGIGFTFLVFVFGIVIGVVGLDNGFAAFAAAGYSAVATGFPIGFFRHGADLVLDSVG